MLELYCLFSLTGFIAERCITKMNIPAWSQPVLMSGPQIIFGPGADTAAPYTSTTWKQALLLLPCLQFIGWPIFMVVYGVKAFPDDVAVRFTASACMAAGGMYLSAGIWFCIGLLFLESKWFGWCKNVCWFIAVGAACLSKLAAFGLGTLQVAMGEPGIFVTPQNRWTIPHISG
ncbi:hypothetical protein B0J13DRAFT_571066 [Dactylonectria estremocensis]|uniref:Uncharacterized protein n=1 Tax=Dactylonectria estremocensis TaxID=1079267 RepID=A0A9P9ID57_9HYPO|nr:hypothetical protein B0J13DRAFT_576092 [Dactylonectria estremocensis]KAH7117243.1 hypothetical protein B0J13DRAFT_571066 [Dactylonectria estremocensis]